MELVLATEAAVVEGTGAAGPLSRLATPDMKSWLVNTACPTSLVKALMLLLSFRNITYF